MRTPATVGLFLLLFVSAAFAQSEPSQRHAITGTVIVPYTQNYNPLEVRLISDTEIPMGRTFASPQERFVFSNLPAGRYYVLVNAPGYKPVRQRVDVGGFDVSVAAPVTLDPMEERSQPKPLYLTGETGLVDVTEMAQPTKARKYLVEAEKKLRNGALSDARSRLESVVREAPDSYDGHRLLAAVYQQSRRYADAENEYRAAQNLRPRSVEPRLGLGSLYLEQIDNGATPHAAHLILEEARKILIQAVQINPDAALGHYLLGATYHKTASHRAAETSFRRALELEPRLGEARLGLVNVYIRENNWPAVLAELDIYLKENPRATNREQIRNKRAEVQRIANGQGAVSAQR